MNMKPTYLHQLIFALFISSTVSVVDYKETEPVAISGIKY